VCVCVCVGVCVCWCVCVRECVCVCVWSAVPLRSLTDPCVCEREREYLCVGVVCAYVCVFAFETIDTSVCMCVCVCVYLSLSLSLSLSLARAVSRFTGKNSLKPALRSFYIVHWAVRWLLRISTHTRLIENTLCILQSQHEPFLSLEFHR